MPSSNTPENQPRAGESTSSLTQTQVRRSLKASILDGSFYAVMQGLTQNYITPFALVMKATTGQIGLLSSIPNGMMSLAQLVGPMFSERLGSRRRLVMLMGLLHAMMWLPILLIPFVFSSHQVTWLIAFMSLSTIFDAISQPAWGSMMADLVPEDIRGRFFGNRNRIAGIISGVFAYVAAGILQILTGNPRLAFAVIFLGATAARIVSFYYLSQMVEPVTATIAKKVHTSIWEISKTLPSSNIGKFIIFCALFNFSVMLSGPFFSPYMLEELGFNYVIYSIINSASGIATIVFLSWWGKRTDKAGNIIILRITAFMVPFIPVAWAVSQNFWWLIAAQVFSGFAWAGFQLASSLFIYDASPPDNRSRYIAVYNSLSFLGFSLGSLAGGLVLPILPPVAGSQYLSIFLLSGFVRLLFVALLVTQITEVRHVPVFNARTILLDDVNPGKLKKIAGKIDRILKNKKG